MLKRQRKNQAFTLIEILIVVTIIALIILVFMQNALRYLSRSRDAERKTDLQDIEVGFQQYYDDHSYYPLETDILVDCGQPFENYIKEIPCDPLDGAPYIYDPELDGSAYRVLARLENEEDPIIDELACGGTAGCGYTNQPTFNYGASEGRRVSDYESNTDGPSSSPNPGPSSTPDPCFDQPQQEFVCEQSSGLCQSCGGQPCPTGYIVYGCLTHCQDSCEQFAP